MSQSTDTSIEKETTALNKRFHLYNELKAELAKGVHRFEDIKDNDRKAELEIGANPLLTPMKKNDDDGDVQSVEGV